MNREEIVKLLTYKGGWMGGEWLANEMPFDPYSVKSIVISKRHYKPIVKVTHGYDSDHGHTYNWQRLDLFVRGEFGTLISVKDIMDRRYKVRLILHALFNVTRI